MREWCYPLAEKRGPMLATKRVFLSGLMAILAFAPGRRGSR